MLFEMLRRSRALARDGLGDLLVAQLASLGAGIFVTFSTAFFMGPGGRGELAFVLTLGNLGGALAFGSLHVGAVQADQAGFSDGPRVARRLALLSSLGILVIAFVAFALLSNKDEDLSHSVLMAGVGASLVTVNLAILRIGQALNLNRAYRNCWMIQGLGFAALGTLAAWLSGRPEIVIASWLLATATSTWTMARAVDWSGGGAAPASPVRVLRDSWEAHAGTVGAQFLSRMHIVSLGLFSTHDQVGLFSVAAPIAEMTWLVSEAFSLLAFRLAAHGTSREEQRRLVVAHAAISVVGAIAVFGVAVVTLPHILPEFDGAIVLVAILIPGVLMQGFSRVAMSRIIGRSHRRTTLLLGAGSMLVSLTYIPVSEAAGAAGVAIAASVLFCLQGAVVIYVDRRLDHGNLG